jgi:aminoglycoside 6-adenylyltransferase
MARMERPGDQYSDRDLLLYATDAENERYFDWMCDYAPVWMVIRHEKSSNPFRAIVYRGGPAIHLAIDTVEVLQGMVDSQRLDGDMWRGYKILMDKDGLAAKLAPPALPPYENPSAAAFIHCIESYFYGTLLLAKDVQRGHLWTFQQDNTVEQGFLLRMIEWHAHLFSAVKPWHRGEFMREWVSPETWQMLHDSFGRFDVEDSWNALFASTQLFCKLAQEIAVQLGYAFPETMTSEIISYLERLRSGKQ